MCIAERVICVHCASYVLALFCGSCAIILRIIRVKSRCLLS